MGSLFTTHLGCVAQVYIVLSVATRDMMNKNHKIKNPTKI